MNKTRQLEQTLVRVRPAEDIRSRQNLPYFVGVSGETTGATGISLNLVVIPAGGRAEKRARRRAIPAELRNIPAAHRARPHRLAA